MVMTIQLSAGSFLQMLARSGLLSDEQMTHVEERFSVSPGEVSTGQIGDWLQQQQLVTDWQAEKLRQAKFRGFFLGPYKLLARIARGGMSSIYSAQHRDSGEIHALKVLPPARTNQTSYLSRFQREAAMTQRLQHPNIVRVFGIFSESDGQDAVHFMAMELLNGRDLFRIVHADGPLHCRVAAEFIRQAALGLEYAHQAGMVHRDIKPGNLFAADDGQIRILDLGLAQDFDSDENLTRDFNERVLGTADYLAPEQAADSHTVDGRADIYSLGCSLYFLLTGQPPFTEGTLVQRLIAHQKNTPPPISQFRNDVPDELATIVTAMMAKNRNDRIGSAAETADRLGRFLEHTVDDSSPDRLPCPVELKSDEKVESCFLPAFTELLQQIEVECRKPGSLSADARSAHLLALARDLLNPQDAAVSAVVLLSAAEEVQAVALTIEPKPQFTGKPFDGFSRRSLWWMVALTGVTLLAVAAAVASTIDWNRLQSQLESHWPH